MEQPTHSGYRRRVRGRRALALLGAVACVACFTGAAAEAQNLTAPGGPLIGTESGADTDPSLPLPAEIEALLEAEPLPPIAVSPGGRYLLLVHEHQLLSLDRLAEPAIRIAGHRINPRTTAAHAPLEYYGLTLVDLATGRDTRLALPHGAVISYPRWAPNGARFVFSLSTEGGTEVWVGEPAEARIRPLAHSINAALGSPCVWSPDSRRLLCRRIPAPQPRGRAIAVEELVEQTARSPGLGQPLVLNPSRVSELLESQLELIDVESGQRHLIGAPAAIEALEPAPAGAFLLVTRLVEPYPRIEGVDAVERATEIWDRFGNVVATLPPAARAARWQAGQPATAVWIEQRDGGDELMLLAPPYADPPAQRFRIPHRFSGLYWIGETDAALVSDYVRDAGRTDLWSVDIGGASPARLVTSYPANVPHTPIMTTNAFGQPVAMAHGDGIYLRGEARAAGRTRPYLEHVALGTGEHRLVWSAEDADGYETLIDVLTADARLLLTRRETAASPPNYFVSSPEGELLLPLTHIEHPAPEFARARRVPLRYERDDGIELGASLYVPPDADARLPLVVWAYPRNVTPGAATDLPSSQERFPTFERAFRLFFLLHGYAVLDDVAMPIVGTENGGNDTFIEQIVANAGAAIRAAADTGYVDAERVGVAGHSYGAFMVANLLAHSDLFGAGVALSGAYNRTLTPFGFQTERRTLWEAPDTYLAMSPLLFSHQIEAPLLLVHGLDDDNASTSPLQSTQFYAAIRGNGGDAELLLLPWEGHSYRARESVLETAAAMLDWFDRNLKPVPTIVAQKETGASLRPSL